MAYNKDQWISSFEDQLSILRPHLTDRVLGTMSLTAWHQHGERTKIRSRLRGIGPSRSTGRGLQARRSGSVLHSGAKGKWTVAQVRGFANAAPDLIVTHATRDVRGTL